MPLPSALADPHRYRFRATWTFPVSPDVLYAHLERPESYPVWWPQVRSMELSGPDTGTLRFRSFLPFTLVLTARGHRDPEARTLRIDMTGDLEGHASWT
ncbi:SRPBCC family protein, partial [Streptomyces sp. UNOC14_S4]|uniref:SRPBCC family protein n=1 Tax=Streptomyces sp. UNOC14_S4 TaxID=2872340 RepID=UPI0023AEF654